MIEKVSRQTAAQRKNPWLKDFVQILTEIPSWV